MQRNRFIPAAILAAASLAGCAGLQVDVDVYKGPLANSNETQEQQLASMALSAKPLIIEYRNLLLTKLPETLTQRIGDRSDFIPQSTLSRASETQAEPSDPVERDRFRNVKQLNGILSFYRDRCTKGQRVPSQQGRQGGTPICVEVNDADAYAFSRGRPDEGIETLADRLAQRTSASGKSGEQPASDGQAPADPNKKLLDTILVDFAARVQFVTANQWLLTPEGQATDELGDRLKTLLETVSNSIMVHADEQRRREKHDARHRNLKAGEVAAASSVMRPHAQATYDNLRRQVEETLQLAGARTSGTASSALDATQVEAMAASVEKRRIAAVGALAAVWMLSPVQQDKVARDALEAATLIAPDAATALPELKASLQRSVPASATTTVAELKAGVDAWAKARLDADADLPAAALAAKPDHRVAAAFREQFQALSVAEPATPKRRDELFALLRPGAISRSAETLDAHRSAVALLRKLRPAPAAGASPGALTPEQLATLQAWFASNRDTIVAAALREPKPDEPIAVKKQMETELKRYQEALKASGKSTVGADAALKALGTVRVAQPSGQNVDDAQDSVAVIDAYITDLRYQYLQSVRTGGEDSAEARNLAAALSAARKQRADMTYVRPSSVYLRSSLSSSFAQENPHVRWTNMLNDTMQNLGRAFGANTALTKTREDLDKVFWQNINRVRLNAGGLTNYVLAKDDVGNWYVKGMGSDPSAMINAAKNLALYNMGSRLDTNLLRIDELRTRLDTTPNASADQRTSWNDELGRLTGANSGPVVGDRTGSLERFQRNYDLKTANHAQALSTALQSQGYRQQLRDRWARHGGAVTAALASHLAKPEVEKFWTEAAAALQTVTPDTPVSHAIIKSLQALDAYRSALKSSITADPALVQASATELTQAQSAHKAAQERVSAASATLQESSAAVTRTAAALQKARDAGADDAELDRLRSTATEAVAANDRAVSAYGRELDALAKVRADLTARELGLQSATETRRQAAEDVDSVFRPVLREWIQKRIRVVEEFETAATVLGRR